MPLRLPLHHILDNPLLRTKEVIVSKKNFALASIVFVFTFAACAPPAPLNAPGITGAAGDWSSYNRTLAGDRFSPLAEINRSNVAQLKSVCVYTLPEVTLTADRTHCRRRTMFYHHRHDFLRNRRCNLRRDSGSRFAIAHRQAGSLSTADSPG